MLVFGVGFGCKFVRFLYRTMSGQLTLYSDEPFLLSVARKIVIQHRQDLPFVHVVLPTRRACLHFKQHLSELYTEPFLAPKVMSINDFIHSATGILPASTVELLLLLHQEYARLHRMDLGSFASLGMAMLEDFALIERNLDQSRAGKFFTWLEEAKAIDRWAEELGEAPQLGAKAKENLNFWHHFKITYKSFRKRLKSERRGFSALVYRLFLEDFDLLKESGAFRFVNWVGFNQLTQVEVQIIERTTKEGCGAAFWDYDAFYSQQTKPGQEASAHEAGYYFRYLQEKKLFYNSPNFVKDRIRTQAKSLTVWALPNRAAQANKAAQLLDSLVEQEPDFAQKINFLAILLPDESLLQPLLRSLPEEITEHVNVTMGLRLVHSQAFRLVKIFFTLHKNASPQGYRSADIAQLLAHPFLLHRGHSQEFKEQLKAIRVLLREKPRIQKTELAGEIDVFFASWTQAYECAENLSLALVWASKPLKIRSYLENIEREFTARIYQAITELKNSIPNESAELFERLLLEVLRNESVPFSGQPLASIQVMGLLESRTLDFEHIIVLSCNEGVLPQAKKSDSIIPFELKRFYRLQTHREHDAAVAYTFYRLLHHCKTAHFLYDDSNTLGRSRFLKQIEVELAHVPLINFTHKTISLPQPAEQDLELKIEKTPQVIEKLIEKLEQGISPSAINRFFKNPLQFYLNDVLGLLPEQTTDENLDAAEFGNLVHKGLELIFRPFLHKNIENLGFVSYDIENAVQQAAKEELSDSSLTDQGVNFLLKQTAVLLIENFLQIHKDHKAKLLAIEFPASTELPLEIGQRKKITLRIKGVIDRIDWQDNVLKIIDYKTGTLFDKSLKAKHWDELYHPDKGKILQLLLYKYILLKKLPEELTAHLPPHAQSDCQVEAGFYFLKTKEKKFHSYTFESEPQDNAVFLAQIESFLGQVVDMMLDESRPLTQEPILSFFQEQEDSD